MSRVMIVVACACALLASCASAPKPPVVSGTNRSAVNDATTAETLRLKAELAAQKARAQELERRALAATPVATQTTPPAPASQTIVVYFPSNSTRFAPTPEEESALLPLLINARRIEIRGRTDAGEPSASQERLAFRRAQAAANYLVAHGIPETKMSLNYLSSGDPVGDPGSATGRAKNRRVEIEVFKEPS